MPLILRFVTTMAAFAAAASIAAAGEVQHALNDAVRGRDATAVAMLLRSGSDPNIPDSDSAVPLHWASHVNDIAIAKLLIDAGADVDASNQYGVTPLHLACINASPQMVSLLLTSGADPRLALPTGETPLMTAARTGSLEAVRLLIQHGSDVNAREELRGQTSLMWAIAEGHIEIVRLLLDSGAGVNARSAPGRPRENGLAQFRRAREGASNLGERQRANSMFSVRIDGTRTDGGFTPLLFAAREGDLDLIRLLVERGADIHATSSLGVDALVVACVRGHVEVAKFLLERGADPNAMGAGYAALHWAAGTWETVATHDYPVGAGEWKALAGIPDRRRKLELINSLLDHGADPNIRTTDVPPRFGFTQLNVVRLLGGTPFFFAAAAADVEVMRLLVSRGADPLQATEDNSSPLLAAAGITYVDEENLAPESRYLEAVKLIVELGGDVNRGNDAGETPLHATAYEGFDAIAKFLIAQGATLDARNVLGQTPLQLAEGVEVRGKFYIHPSTAALLREAGASLQ